MTEINKIIEVITKLYCNKENYCSYLGNNCYEFCKIRILINEIEKNLKKE